MRTDPRIVQSLNRIATNLENASENARAGCFAFTTYLEPFFTSLSDTCVSCTLFCMPGDRHGNRRARNRARAEYPFDFYNDYYEEETNDFFGWGSDELDRLLAGSGSSSRGYTRQPIMSYGIGGHTGGSLNVRGQGRRKSAVVPHDGRPDPTIIPNTSYLGFLGRIPFMRSTLRYKPSAADLQDHPGAGRDQDGNRRGLFRRRSGTTSSGDTDNSMRSRADLFPSEDEDDAVPLDDEFDVNLRSGPSSETNLAAMRRKKGKKPRSLGSSSLKTNSSAGDTSAEQTPVEEYSVASRLMVPDVDYSSDISHHSPTTRSRPSRVSSSRNSSYPASLSDVSISENTNLLADPTADEQSYRLPSEATGEDAKPLDINEVTAALEYRHSEPTWSEVADTLSEANQNVSSASDTKQPIEAEEARENKAIEESKPVPLEETHLAPLSPLPPNETVVSPPKSSNDEAKAMHVKLPPPTEILLEGNTEVAETKLPKPVTFKFQKLEKDAEASSNVLEGSIPIGPPLSETPLRIHAIPIPNSKSPPRPSVSFSKSFTEPSHHPLLSASPPHPHAETRSLSSSPTQSPKQSKGLIERSLGLWTWSKLEEWFPPVVPKEEWLNSGFDEDKGATNEGKYGGGERWRVDDEDEEGLVRRWKRSMDVIRD